MLFVFVFILGLLWGSFMNVLVIRGISLRALWGHSQCRHCHKQLRWYDLIPVFSYLYLRGKCRYCKKKVSAKYAMGEIFTGIIFVLSLQLFLSSTLSVPGLFLLIVYISLFLYLSLYDLWNLEIPLMGVILLLFVGLIFNLYHLIWESSLLTKGWFLALIVPIVLIALISRMYKKQVFGAGDYMIMLAVALTLRAIELFIAFEAAIFIAALISLLLVIIMRVDMKEYKVPLVPFLFLGWCIGYIWGMNIWNWLVLN